MQRSGIEKCKCTYLDALAGQDVGVTTRVFKCAVRCTLCSSARSGVIVLEQPHLVTTHVGCVVPLLLQIVDEIVDLATSVAVAELGGLKTLGHHCGSVAYGERRIAQWSPYGSPQIDLEEPGAEKFVGRRTQLVP